MPLRISGTSDDGTRTGGSTVTGGSSGRISRSRTVRKSTFDSENLVDTALSIEDAVTLTTGNQTAQIKWNTFAGALGYRVFLYQKDAQGSLLNCKYFDVSPHTLAFTWAHSEGATDGTPSNMNRFNVMPEVNVWRAVDLNGDAGGYQYIAAYAKSLLKTYGGLTDAELDTTSFSTFNAGYHEPISRYIDNQTTLRTLVAEVEASSFGSLMPVGTNAIKLGLYLLDPSKAPAVNFTDLDFISAPVISRLDRAATYNRVEVDYGHSAIDNSLSIVSATVSEADWKYSNTETYEFSSILAWRDSNRRLAVMLATTLKQPSSSATVTVRSKGFSVKLGDVISVNRSRGFTVTGTYNDERWLVTGLSPNTEEATVEITASTVWKFAERVRKWASDAVTHNWTTATAQEKIDYGFWHDEGSLVSTTWKHSVWGLR